LAGGAFLPDVARHRVPGGVSSALYHSVMRISAERPDINGTLEASSECWAPSSRRGVFGRSGL